jgi:uncharacterized membrane protein HdeD (DUF308 family)
VRAAARRIVVLFGSAVISIGLISGLVGLAFGSSFPRGAAVGLYLVGCFLIVLGVFAGVRGPLRPSGSEEEGDALGSLLGVGIFSKGVRTATSDERADARSTAWLFLAMGLTMILVGIALDPRTALF